MPSEPSLVKIAVLYDPAEAEVLRGLLEAQGLRVLLSKEAAGQVYGVFAGTMGEIEVYVAAGDEEAARAVVGEFRGKPI